MASFNSSNAFLASPYLEKIIAPNPTTERGQAIKVNSHPTLPLLIYPCGKFIVVKNYLNPVECFVYRGHIAACTVAKFSPNGFWIASGDATGKVRVWSWDNPEHLTKIEVPVFAAPVYDLDWDNESKKIVACGDGSGIIVKCFTWDTGSSAGEMLGHSKRVLSVAYKPSRPYRIMSGGEDMRTLFYAGPPFKLDHSNASCHSNFVNCVRYSSDGRYLASVGSDKKIMVYDGSDGQPVTEAANLHEGGIYGVAFAMKNPTMLATVSADKTMKLWEISTTSSPTTSTSLTLRQTVQIEAEEGGGAVLGDSQVAVTWPTSDVILSVSLQGDVNLVDAAAGRRTGRLVAHQTAVTAFCLDPSTASSMMVYSGSIEGTVLARDLTSPTLAANRFTSPLTKASAYGVAHGGKVSGMVCLAGEGGTGPSTLVSVGWDDRIRWASCDPSTASGYRYHSEQALNGQPVGLAVAASPIADCVTSLVVVVTLQEVAFYRGQDKLFGKEVSWLKYTPTCASLTMAEDEVAIGGSDNKTHVYALDLAQLTLTEITAIETRSAVSCLAYNPANDLLAIGDQGRQVEVYERGGSWTPRIKGKWVYHTSRVTCLAWSASGSYLATGSLDENIFIWNLTKPLSKLQMAFSHTGGVNALAWVMGGSQDSGEERLLSCGNDAVMVQWKIPPPPTA